MLREGLFKATRWQDPDLDAFLLAIYSSNGSRYNFHAGTKAGLLQDLWERRFQDQVNWPKFVSGGPGSQRKARQLVDDIHTDYLAELQNRGMVDFSLLENEVLSRLRSGKLAEFTKELKVVLVDEYQDTNLLQEQLYFELAAACNGAMAVVGDDDQSLYRFRGATVDLYRDFATRFQAKFGTTPQTIFLTDNYRSSTNVITLVNSYAALDAGYQPVRVASKPQLNPGPTAATGLPVMGMFRANIGTLAADLAQLIRRVFRGSGFKCPGGGVIQKDPKGGDIGDCALLCSSPAEFSASGNPRLPLLLRQYLGALNPPIQVFNPRGEDLTGIAIISQFGGLLLECLDPGGLLEGQISGISQDALNTFQTWRNAAITYAQGPTAPAGLLDYATKWADRDPGRAGYVWPKNVSAIELIYRLVHFFPALHDDPEGQVFLEVFTRQLGACEQVGKFSGRVVTDPTNTGLSEASVKELLRDFLAPIASGLIGVNEDLVETFPRDRLSILSIHQSKGLEFPLTIVDVGSEFKDLRSPKFKRYPDDGGPPHRLEDLLRPHSPLGVPTRSQVDRAFDDLYRQFFVALSRPQDVLLLVGVDPTAPGGRVPNVATGWDRTGACIWAPPGTPFTMI
jgi:DNA helicase-2/ATP-dependent DNA helicase PcrA